MRQLRFSSQFKRDMKRVKRSRGGNMDEIDHVVDLLLTDTPLPARCHDHPLKGNWRPARECHVRPDILLIYEKTPAILHLMRLGSHSELLE